MTPVVNLQDVRDMREMQWQVSALKFEVERRAFSSAPDRQEYIDALLCELRRIESALVRLRGGLQ
jgi:Ni,Fe-hydrogenase III large subunit